MATFTEIMNTPGRMLNKQIINDDNDSSYFSLHAIKNCKYGYNTSLTDGTLCSYLIVEASENINIPKTDKVIFRVIATDPLGQSATKNYDIFYFYSKEYDASTKNYIYTFYTGIVKAMIKYEPLTLTYPISVQNYFNALVTRRGWTSNITLDVTGNKMLSEDIYDNQDLTERDILNDILQANGIIGNLVYDQFLEKGSVVVSTAITDDILKNENIEIGEKVGPINRLTLTRANETDNISYEDSASISTNGLHELVISNNILLNENDREDYIQALFNKYKNKVWYIFDLELVGMGGITALGQITIQTNNNSYTSLLFNDEITFDEGFKESIYNEKQNQTKVEHTYTSKEEKQDKNAEIIINKKIGEVDIRGKTINLTGDVINIASTYFNVDSGGNVDANSIKVKGGELANFNVNQDDLSVIIQPNYDYSQTDIDTIRNIIISGTTPTQAQLDKYDLNGDGRITIQDLLRVSKFIDFGISHTNPGYFKIHTATGSKNLFENKVGFFNSDGDLITGFNWSGVYANKRRLDENEELWSGAWYMNDTQTITLSERVSDQPNGIVLVWSRYDITNSTPIDGTWQFTFVPKSFIDIYGGGNGISVLLGGNKFSIMATKYVYVSDTTISGHADNTASGTGSGITYNNRNYVLRYVIGV